ncbi:Ca2+-dependent phosphoinositide-specific phospholipase C [Pokkaliibacter sp. CJK22405]|uniref:Ca2+-dependent phosphoinositide-specific phospholipase C n=1 Tax=Pokkaliibacter sp. CJK22405 TaxID=3384615 RepID=UPI003984EC00
MNEEAAYSAVRQKGSHNSYQRSEGYIDQALYWRIRSLEIDIHNGNDASGWPTLQGDWYVYHAAVVDQSSTVNQLSDALAVLRAFHLAVPDHEVVTIWLDLKDHFTATNHTPEALDQLLVEGLGREAIWGPPDLIGTEPDLQQAIQQHGWPSLEALRGKFIFACTTGNLSSPDSQLNQYVDNGKTANQRLAFVAPEISSTDQILQFTYAVVFNLSSSHTSLGQAIQEQGFISRAYGLDSQSSWCKGWQTQVNHLTTNKVNAFSDEWARTDNPSTGYPFDFLGGDQGEPLVEPGALFAIRVNSGDLWSKEDSGYFQFDNLSGSPDRTFTGFVGNPASHVDGWIKGGLMARASTAANAAYCAVLRTGSHGIRLQCRSAAGDKSTAIDAVIPNGVNGHSRVSANTPIWLRLEVQAQGNKATGYYSIDGSSWISIGSVSVNAPLVLQGWVASSHGSGEVKWLFGGAPAPAEGIILGSKASGTFLSSSAQAASLGTKPASACCPVS